MLAEPRGRKNYTLVPKGKPLYEDETRFGTVLMQKMGWTKGRGLGRDESGTKDFLRVRYKNDAKGLGFKARDDQWTQHEQSFNGLLSTLNGKEKQENYIAHKSKQVTSEESEDEIPRMGFGFQEKTAKDEVKPKMEIVVKLKEKISGISLEEKSKQSRARVHYQKFTRGKDLSQYSEKDLANIFGKKVDEESREAISEQEQLAAVDETINDDKNVQFLHTGISVSDYFKMKMQAKRKLKNGGKSNTNDTSACMVINYDAKEVHRQENVSKKKRKKEDKLKDAENGDQVEVFTKKAKKSKKNKHKELDSENAAENEFQFTNFEYNDFKEEKKKKNKLPKNKAQEDLQEKEDQLEKEQADCYIKRKKRKQEILVKENKGCTESVRAVDSANEPVKKKRKKNKKEKDEIKSDERTPETQINLGDSQTSSTNKKKNKNRELPTVHQQTSKMPSENSDANKTKDLSCNANDDLTKDANNKNLKYDDIEKLYNSYNIYSISSFCAEKFRNLNFNDFKGSILSQIEGYGFSKDLQLDIHVNKYDEERIMNLWKGILDKYTHLEKPKKTYRHYVKEVIKARKTKQKRPKLYIKAWKRKNAFQII